MNNKQLIVAWAMGALISTLTWLIGTGSYYSRIPDLIIEYLAYCLPILIIGSLLIYTLRDR